MKKAIVIYHLILFWVITLSAQDSSVHCNTFYTQTFQQGLSTIDTHFDAHSVVPVVEEEIEKDKERAILLKTNLLYDAVAVPNVGLEVSLNAIWSLGINWVYAWWSNDTKHRFIRTYGGDVELRRWILPNRKNRTLICGHHIGIYGQLLTYDIEWGGVGYLGDRWSWAVGLSYGYSLPIGTQFNIDFTLGVGYMKGDYMKYHPKDGCYVWDSTHNRKWFGPTKAEVSLVWYMGGRYTRKGGER